MDMIVDMAKVMSKGQITIPKEIRKKLGVDTGDKVMIIWDGERVSMMNPVAYALKMVQKEMENFQNLQWKLFQLLHIHNQLLEPKLNLCVVLV